MTKSDPFDRLASLRVEMTPEARERHLAVISEAVRTAPPVRAQRRLGFRRRWAVAIASLTAIVAPVGTAVAAESALPGEVLYPVKQISEQVRAVFDEDLPARHRVEELERLLTGEAEPAVIADAQQRAEAAVGALDQPGELAGRLEQVRQQVRVRFADDPAFEPSGEPDPAGPGGGPGTTMGPGPSDDPGSGGDGPGPGHGSGSGTTPSTTAPGAGGSGGSGSGGSGSGGDGSGGGGSSGNGSGDGGDGSGNDGGPGTGDGGGGSGGDGGDGASAGSAANGSDGGTGGSGGSGG